MNNKSKGEGTLIPIRKTTRERLYDIGRKGESYDKLINKLIDSWLKYRKP